MRLLFEMDRKDYEDCTHDYVRNSARAIIIRDGRVAMVHSQKFDYYKFPGGGIEEGEDPVDAMIRETREEGGLVILPESVREYGCVHRVQRSDYDETERFVQDNFYYLCEAKEGKVPQDLDSYEEDEGYALEYVEPVTAIKKNRAVSDSPFNKAMFEREALVLELLIREGII
ncbi:MAG: NUDIX domain-containing protein [Erysipelotrichaceae bacterium]|nr:NUDIX domain-containing protein [Erysipelotrichaceae bacterium]